MKTFLAIGSFIAASIFLFGCDAVTVPSSQPAADEAITARAVAANKATHSTSNIYEWPPSDPLILVEEASATLVRNKNGVRLSVHTASLTPGFAYTVWMIAFDKPGNCTDGCGEDEVNAAFDPDDPNAAEVTIFGAIAGGLAGETGTATFSGHRTPGAPANDILVGDGSLDNPMTAEVHFVVRCHGPKIPGMVRAQTTTFNGGCNAGEPNEGACVDVQFGVFPAG